MGNNVRNVLHILITMHWIRVTQLLGTGLNGDKSKSTCGHRILVFMAYNSMKGYQNLINWKVHQWLIQQFGLVQHVDCLLTCLYAFFFFEKRESKEERHNRDIGRH